MTAFSVPITVGACQSAGRIELEAAVDVDPHAELDERVDVRVESPPPDHVAARRRQHGTAEAREQRAGEQERGADALGEQRVQLDLAHVGGLHAHFVRPRPVDLDSEVGDQLDHGLDVPDARDVGKPDGLPGEERRGEDRQRTVLVSGG
jgi:hypothetical protein